MTGTKTVRLLKAAEIECRIGTINEKGLSLLLFKDARVDQKILDETYTPLGWRRSHQAIDGNLYCTVEVWDEDKKQWVGKQDVGTMSYSEKEKGQASDSFKRAGFNWGIGRELYTAPFIWIPAAKAKVYQKGGRYATNERFSVKSIGYNDDREIAALEIVDSKGEAVYSLRQRESDGSAPKGERNPSGSGAERASGQKPASKGKAGTERDAGKPAQDGQEGQGCIGNRKEVVLMAELNRTGISLGQVLERYKIGSLSQMTPEIYDRAIAALKQTKPKRAA
nr:hypothetical protein [uncultured Acetatifactor sp.]